MGCSQANRTETIKIKPLGFTEEVEVIVDFICECDCHKDAIEGDDVCHGNGSFECGACKSVAGRETREGDPLRSDSMRRPG